LNNLRQLGIGIHNFENEKSVFPPGGLRHREPLKTGISWRVLILPYIEQQSLFDLIDPQPDGGAGNISPEQQLLSVFECPSAELDTTTWKQSNYFGVGGAGKGDQSLKVGGPCGPVFTDGIFFPSSETKIAAITDGTSHTLAIGERTYLFRSWPAGVTWKGDPPDRICSISSKNITLPVNASHEEFGYYVSDGRAPAGAAYKIRENDLFFGSEHPGGANFCFADGSVQFVPESIDFTIYEDLATINGGEIDRY